MSASRTLRTLTAATLASAGAVGLVAAILWGIPGQGTVFSVPAAQAVQAPEPPPVPASIAAVERWAVDLWSRHSGRLEAVERVEIRSRVAGALEAAHFREGSLVEKGAPLLTIDPAPFEAAVARAASDLEAAKARLAFAEGERDRGARLQGNRTITASEYERRFQAGLEAQAQVAAADAVLRSARLDLAYTDIRAPISGRIGQLEITAGNLVSAGAGSPVLARIVSVDPIYAAFDADEETVERLLRAAGGQDRIDAIPVEMDLSDGRSLTGRIQLVDPSVDPANGTVGLRVAFPNPDGALMPGQFARIRLGSPQAEPALLLSERAIGTDQDKRYVLVVDDRDVVQYREIELGAATGGMRVVEGGLSAGERVVVNGLQRLRPGARIAPQIVSMSPPDSPGAVPRIEANVR